MEGESYLITSSPALKVPKKPHILSNTRTRILYLSMNITTANQLKVIASQLSEKAEIIVANHGVYEQYKTSADLKDILTGEYLR